MARNDKMAGTVERRTCGRTTRSRAWCAWECSERPVWIAVSPSLPYMTFNLESKKRASCSIFSWSFVAADLRAINTMSKPSNGAFRFRAVWRRTRLHRFLNGAFPSFLPAMNAQRPFFEAGFSNAMIVREDEEERLPAWKRRSTSSLLLIVPLIRYQSSGDKALKASFRPSGARDPLHGEPSERCDHHGLPCENESHDTLHVCACWVDMYASFDSS